MARDNVCVRAMAQQQRHERMEALKLQRRIEHVLRQHADDGETCVLTLSALEERFGCSDQHIRRIARAIGIRIAHEREMEVKPDELRGRCNIHSDAKTAADHRAAWKRGTWRARLARQEAAKRQEDPLGRIPDGGARETLRQRMQPHPWMEVAT